MLGILLPYPWEVITTTPADIPWAERYIHDKLADVRINGEWFALTRPQLEWLIVLGSPYSWDLDEDNRKELDGGFRFYVERLHYDPE